MNLSYWEYRSWFEDTDCTVVGSGIVGLSCALQLRKRYPDARILVLEKGLLPQGASTKNAGFACFGSLSELLSDLEHHTEAEVVELVQKRWDGIRNLRQVLGDERIAYQNLGGHELFLHDQKELFERCLDRLEAINRLLVPVFGSAPFRLQANIFGFKGVQDHYISHAFEGQLDTGKMMLALLREAVRQDILILNGLGVNEFEEEGGWVRVATEFTEFRTRRLFLCTNGFASTLMGEEVQPARAQVLVTNTIKSLPIRGTFHLDEGYYYFRNIDNRILFGGGRNLDFKGETTLEPGITPRIQDRLETLLKEVILPGIPFEVTQRWSGVMGVGAQKKPIIRQLSDRVFCGVRLGGMGIAIGSLVGRDLANLPD